LTLRNNNVLDLTIDGFPSHLEHLDLSENVLEGNLILFRQRNDEDDSSNHGKTIPAPFIERIILHSNGLCGTVDLQNLPKHLLRIDLSYNRIEYLEGGPKCFDRLPPLLDSIDLSANRIRIKDLDLNCIPENIERVILSENFFSGTLDFSKESSSRKSFKQLLMADNFLEFELKLGDLANFPYLTSVDLSNNKLFGRLDMEDLAVSKNQVLAGWKGGAGFKVHSLNLAGNSFDQLTEGESNDGKYFENKFFAVQL